MPFRVVPARDRVFHALAGRSPREDLEPGQVVYAVDDPADEVLLVGAGHLAATDRSHRTLDLVGPAELAGLEALGEGGVRRWGLRALVAASVTRIDGAAALRTLRRGRRTLPLVLESLVRDAERFRRRSGGAGAPDAETRLARVVDDLVERFGGEAATLPGPVTHRLLGELAGLHRSTVTTVLNDWLYRGVLRQSGRSLSVVDRAALAECAEGG